MDLFINLDFVMSHCYRSVYLKKSLIRQTVMTFFQQNFEPYGPFELIKTIDTSVFYDHKIKYATPVYNTNEYVNISEFIVFK